MLKMLALPALALFATACSSAEKAQMSALEETATAMADAPELTLERLYASPSLSGPTPQGVKYSPDGKRVTFLKSREDEASRYDLWQFDVATGEQSMLVDSKLLEPQEVELSEEEKALRERKRIAGRKGIVSYDWGTAETILVPIGGDLWLVELGKPQFQEVAFELNEDTLTKYDLTAADVAQLFRETYFGTENQTIARDGSSIRAPLAERIPPIEDLRSLVLAVRGDEVVRLSDVAELSLETGPPNVIPRQLTATDAFEYDAKVSPGGRYVSFVRDGAVYAIDLTTNEEARLTPLAEPENAISYGVAEFVAQEEMSRYTGYWWSPDERYLAYTRVDESTVDVIPRFDIAADEVTVIEQRYPRAGRPNAIVDLFVRDKETGDVVEIDWRRDDWGPATDQYLARVNWAGDVVIISSVDRDQTTLRRNRYASETRFSSEPFSSEEQENWINLSFDFSVTDSEPGNIHRAGTISAVLSSEESGYRQLYLHETGKAATALTQGDWEVSSLAFVSKNSELVFFTGYKDSPLERHLYSVSLGGSEPLRLTEMGQSWSVTMSPDGETFIGRSSSPTQPPQTGLYRINTPFTKDDIPEGAKLLPGGYGYDTTPYSKGVTPTYKPKTELIAWIEENALDASHPYHPYLADHTVPEYGTLTAEDGQTLYYSIQTPPDFDPSQKYPVLINVYGGPGVQTVDRDWERWDDQFYTRQGYIVFRLDNRGTANRGKKFEDVIYRQTGGPEVRDQLLGVEWLKSQPFVDADNIAIQGWSYGGYMTLMTILQAPEGTFKAAVSGAPVTDWTLYDTFYTERYMDTPQDNPDGYEKSSVFYHLDRLETEMPNLLLIHGMADDNVTFDNTTRLMAELQERGVVFDLMTYPGQRHGIRGEKLRTHLMRTRMAFLDRHLKRNDQTQ
ncbi:MAG: DPP IV N-terminal domain-containing protein [Pseudomonadota bacterium]